MKTITQWLDLAKEKSGSDYATAKEIGITRQALSKVRNQRTMHNNTALKLAEFLGVNPLEIIASMESERHPEVERNWQKWVAASLIIGMANFAENPLISSANAEILSTNSLY